MTNDPDNQLDDVLRKWADQNAATDAEIEALSERISTAVDQAPFFDAGPMPIRADRFSVFGRVAWFALGSAVALLLAFLLFPTAPVPQNQHPQNQQADIPRPHPEVDHPDPKAPSFAMLEKSQLEGKGLLLAEMERVFADRLTWVAERDGQVCVGVLPEARSASSGAAAMAVRVVVVSRKGKQDAWKPVWQVDVVTRGEQVVELTPESIDRGNLLLWAYPLPDGMIAVDANFALPGPVPLESKFSGVQAAGVPRQMLSIETGDVEYRVFQTVSILDKGTS